MATVTATGAQAIVQPKFVHSGLYSMASRFSFTASVGDVVQMVKVPSGFSVQEILLEAAYSAADSISGIIQVGDDGDPNRFISASATTVGAANTFRLGAGVNTAAFPFLYTVNDTIDVTIGAATGTASASKNITLAMVVMGSVDFQA